MNTTRTACVVPAAGCNIPKALETSIQTVFRPFLYQPGVVPFFTTQFYVYFHGFLRIESLGALQKAEPRN